MRSRPPQAPPWSITLCWYVWFHASLVKAAQLLGIMIVLHPEERILQPFFLSSTSCSKMFPEPYRDGIQVSFRTECSVITYPYHLFFLTWKGSLLGKRRKRETVACLLREMAERAILIILSNYESLHLLPLTLYKERLLWSKLRAVLSMSININT